MQGRHTCDGCVIRNQAICSKLPKDVLADLTALAHRREARPQQAIIIDGDEWTSFANIESGVVKIVHRSSDGKDQILGLMFPGDFIGRPFGDKADYAFEAISHVVLCTFPRAGFETLLHRHPDLDAALLRHALDEIDEQRRWMTLLGHKKAEEKVASFLRMLAHRSGAIQPGEPTPQLQLPLSRTEMADILGLTVETVSRQMTKLRSKGVIELQGARSIHILNSELLSVLADAA